MVANTRNPDNRFLFQEVQVQELLTMKDVAQRFRMSPRTVWTLIQSGQLKSVRIGRLVRVTNEQVTEFINGRSGGK
ncbi:MAG: helix-turn-helix domain-containing protein [Planctomycetales bacterium]|nr:helix-turn-helix domain-containing protein [Planctomycetales bacterium]